MTNLQSPPPKFSRYRSVRQAAGGRVTSSPLAGGPSQIQEDSIQRSKSRYKRRPASSVNTHATHSAPPAPYLPQQFAASNSQASSHNSQNVLMVSSRNQHGLLPLADDSDDDEQGQQRRQALNDLEARERSRIREVEAANRRNQETLRHRQRLDEEATLQKQREAEAIEILAEQKRKDLERLERVLDAAITKSSKANSPKERFALFGRRRRESKSTSRPVEVFPDASANLGVNEYTVTGDLPGADAPKSAINAGERRVLVRYKQSSVNLPVLPETTPVSLMNSAVSLLSAAIDPSSMTLYESYTKLGLERPTRRYEHIRDIMNSWDRDTQNAFVIKPSDLSGHERRLDASSVPKEPPKGVEVSLYHSQKPGRWEKRFITLIVTGQVYVSKRSGAKFSDKDITNICHLSDFDIYTPTHQQIRKSLKPPKKHCYAIKSQQKTTVFLNTENFVHFFSSDHADTMEEWYDAVQAWRSWYLSRQVGRDETRPAPQALVTNAGRTGQESKTMLSASEDSSSRYSTSLSNLPRPQLNRYQSMSPTPSEDDENRPRQIPFHLRNGPLLTPNSPPPNYFAQQPRPTSQNRSSAPMLSPPLDHDETFAATGLLGRTYTQRQKQAAAAAKDSASNGPFIPGPSLLNNPHAHASSVHPKTSHDAPRRAATAPLVDLTPQFIEAPQWRTETKGHGVVAPEGVPLVEVANTPALGGEAPKLTVFQRDASVSSKNRVREHRE